MHPGINYLFIV